MRYLLLALAVLIGAAAVVAGESDDSPGLQGLGVLLVIAAVVLVVRRRRPSETDRRQL